MAKISPSSDWVHLDVQRQLEPDVIAALALGERINDWYAPWLRRLSEINPYDPSAVLAWRNRAIEDAQREFDRSSPVSLIATSAAGHMKVLQEPCSAYHAIREGARFRDALSFIAARVAQDDDLYELVYSHFDATNISQVMDNGLSDLLSSRFGNVERAFWRAVEDINRVEFGRVLTIEFLEFIERLPPPKART